MTTDAEIIRDCRQRPRRFEVLFDRHYDAIRGYLVRRLGVDDGEELAAETFTTAFAQRDRYDLARENARPWLYGIATNLMRHHLRSAERGRRAYARAVEPVAGDGDLEHVPERVDADGRAHEAMVAIDRLDPGDRDVVLLVAWEGLAYAEVAEALHIPVGTVRSRMHRARTLVREHLAETAVTTGEGHP